MPIRGYRFVANDIFPVYMPRSGLSYLANWFAPNGAMLIFALFYYKAIAPNGAFPQSIPVKKMCPNCSRLLPRERYCVCARPLILYCPRIFFTTKTTKKFTKNTKLTCALSGST